MANPAQHIGDTLALLTAAYKLYHDIFLVAKQAGDDFRDLKAEVDINRKLIYKIHKRVNWTRLPDDDVTRDALERCASALQELESIIRKYRSLASSSTRLSWRGIVWASDKERVGACKDRFKEASAKLQLALQIEPITTSGESSTRQRNKPRVLENTPKQVRNQAIRRLPVRNWYPPRPQTSILEEPSTDSSQSAIIQLDADRERHNVREPLHAKFQSSYESLDKVVDTETWLCIATWWFLKSQVVLEILEQGNPEDAIRRSVTTQSFWHTSISKLQAGADLLKSSWILEELILAKDSSDMASSTWEKVVYLSRALHRELSRQRSKESLWPYYQVERMLSQDLGLLEAYRQPAEDPEQMPQAIDNVRDPQRFFVANMCHACDEDEKILHRTFVNAQLGPHNHPARSQSAPFMLILSCQSGRSVLFITLCNQDGTVNLCREAIKADLKMLQEDSRSDGGYRLHFPSKQVIIKFLDAQDQTTFFDFLRNFFDAMAKRNPRLGEIQLCCKSLEYYETRHPAVGQVATAVADVADEMHSFCEATLYEQHPKECWKSTRRLVISSSPSSDAMFCTSFWLPLSQVRIQPEGRKLNLTWSDCQQLETRSDGEGGQWYSCVYNAEQPNRSIDLTFQDQQSAEEFARSILSPFDMALRPYAKALGSFDSTSTGQEVKVYELCDLDDTQSQGCFALVSISQKADLCRVAAVYFVHRDLDFILSGKLEGRISFPSLQIPHYLSNITDLPHEPNEESGVPEFHDVQARWEEAAVALEEPKYVVKLMQVLLNASLRYCRRASCVIVGNTGMLSPFTFATVHKDAVVQIWTKGVEEGMEKIILTIRSTSSDEEIHWLTSNLSDSHQAIDGPRSCKVVLKEITTQEGNEIDSKSLTAIDSSTKKSTVAPEHQRRVTIVFEKSEDSNLFLDRVRTASLLRTRTHTF